jgi:hypothetical protein
VRCCNLRCCTVATSAPLQQVHRCKRALVATSATVHHAVAKQGCNPKLRCCDTPIHRGNAAAAPRARGIPTGRVPARTPAIARCRPTLILGDGLSEHEQVRRIGRDAHIRASRTRTQSAHAHASEGHTRTLYAHIRASRTRTQSAHAHASEGHTRTLSPTHACTGLQSPHVHARAPTHSANTHAHNAHAQVCRIDLQM